MFQNSSRACETRPLIEGLEGRLLMHDGPHLGETDAHPSTDPVVIAAAGATVTGLTLINAATDRVIGPLQTGATLDLRTLGSQLSVRAETSGAPGSVKFVLDGASFKIENAAPYAIRGDVNGDYLPWTPSVGGHVLTVVPYSAANATGTAAPSLTVRFSVVNSQPPPTAGAFTRITWTTRAPSPIGRAEALTATVNGKVYVFGGFSGALGPVARSDVYNPASNTWSPIRALPERTTHAGVATDGRYVYIAGGYVGRAGQTGYAQTFGTRNVWRYDTLTNTYSALPQFPLPRAGGGLVLLGRQLHYFGGDDITRHNTATHYVLNLDNPTGWTTSTPLPLARSHMGYVNFGGRIYAIAGQTGNDAGLTTRSTVHVWDPASPGAWKQLASVPRPLSHISASTFVMGNRIIVAGGESSHGVSVRDVYAYTPATNSWVSLTPLPVARFSGVATTVGGSIYFTTGNSSNLTWKGSPAA